MGVEIGALNQGLAVVADPWGVRGFTPAEFCFQFGGPYLPFVGPRPHPLEEEVVCVVVCYIEYTHRYAKYYGEML